MYRSAVVIDENERSRQVQPLGASPHAAALQPGGSMSFRSAAMKKCRKCARILPLSGFYEIKAMKDGHRHMCKQCYCARETRRRASMTDEERCREQERTRAWYQANREEILARRVKRREANLGKYQATEHAYYLANREKKLAYSKQYQRDHREATNANSHKYAVTHRKQLARRQRDYYRRNPERCSAINRRVAAKHPERATAYTAVHCALAKGMLIRPTACRVCGDKNPQAHHADYTKPLDVEWLCPLCHNTVHRVAKSFVAAIASAGVA